MRKGLILEGGAMRGMFTAGVMDVMMEHRVEFDGIIGVSAGAAFGCNYKSGQIGRVIRYNTRFCQDKRYGGFGVFLRTGDIYSTDFAYGEVPLVHDLFDFDSFEKNPMDFYVVCTDVITGKAVYHKYTGKNDHGLDWIRASASIPFLSKIVEIDGLMLLDGGVADSIPVHFFNDLGYNRNIVVLTRPLGYIKEKNRMMPLIKLRYRKYPEFIKAMESRHILYNATLDFIAQEEAAGRLLVIRPDEALPIKQVEKDPEVLKAVYNMGRNVALRRLDEITKYHS